MTDFIRNTDPELMDSPSVDRRVLELVFQDINRSNRLLGGNGITMRGLEQLITAYPQKSYTILDVGCGDGTLLRAIVKWARMQGLELDCVGVDLNANGLALAKTLSRDFPEIRYLKQDVLKLDATNLNCDILLCTLTMHHFLDSQIPVFLEKFVELAGIGIVINDLQRSRLAYHLFRLFSVIFIRTKIAKRDGLTSIESGFTKAELVRFSKKLPSVTHDIKWRWAFRYVWVMQTKRLKESYE